jgi:hypothetical protein
MFVRAAAAPELNYNVVWNIVPEAVKRAFIGVPKKVKLEPGFQLYKFTEYQIANRSGKITEWWSPLNGYGNDPGLETRLHLAAHLGATAADLARVVAAVSENWNALTHVLKAQVRMPLYAFWGQCSPQLRLEAGNQPRAGIPAAPAHRHNIPVVRTTHLPGYAWQFYIPNLTANHIQQISRNPI